MTSPTPLIFHYHLPFKKRKKKKSSTGESKGSASSDKGYHSSDDTRDRYSKESCTVKKVDGKVRHPERMYNIRVSN
jgi:hypothetical protein